MGKVTVYLPDALEERVRTAGVSMSPVCQRALEEEVLKVEARQNATSEIEQVAARLRGTVADEEREKQDEGYNDGARWAREMATVAELEEMDSLVREYWMSWQPDDEHSIWKFIGVEPGGGAWSHDAWLDGFIEGATSVYDAARPLL